MQIKITADSSCDVPHNLAEERGLEIFPLKINKDGEDFLDGINKQPLVIQ